MMNYDNIPREKFQLINEEIKIKDEAFDAKPIGYYKDAWNRFKKNKASVVAMYFIIGALFLTLFGPYFKKYTLRKDDATMMKNFSMLPPKVSKLESFGIFDGTKIIKGMSPEFVATLPEGIIVEIFDESEVQSTLIDAKVNYYRYHRYVNLYDNKLVNGELVAKTFSLSKRNYEKAIERNAVVRVISITENNYKVQLDLYRYSFDKDVDDVYFWFGTTSEGEDLFTKLWVGSRISLLMALIISLINVTIGVFVGSIVGYYGATLDIIFERLVEILNNVPFIIVLTLLLLRFGSSLGVIAFAFISLGWIGAYGTTRVQTYRYKNREYVLAARTFGAKDRRIITKHILPNAIGTLITAFSLTIPSFIFVESNYSYLKIIDYPGIHSVGRLLSDGQGRLKEGIYHLLLFPAIYISILMLSFNLFSNGLRDAFNPSLRGVDE